MRLKILKELCDKNRICLEIPKEIFKDKPIPKYLIIIDKRKIGLVYEKYQEVVQGRE